MGRYRFGRWELDPVARHLLARGEKVNLGARAFDVLVALVEAQGERVTKDALLERVWQGVVVEEGNLQTQISALRRALGPEGRTLIATDPRQGYRLTVPVQAIAEPGAAPPEPPVSQGRSTLPVLAVLPFEVLSRDPEDSFLAAGLTDDLTTTLARIGSFTVLARATGAQLGVSPGQAVEAARRLSLRYLVSGSVQRAGARIRVNVALADASSAAALWAERIDGEASDVFTLQDLVAARVAAAVDPGVRRAETARLRNAPPRSHDAYEAYLRAMAAIEQVSLENCDRALGLLGEALRQDPEFAPALAASAWCHMWKSSQTAGFETNAEADSAEAVRLAEQAEKLAGSDPIALARVALVFGYAAHRQESALEMARRAVVLHPNGVLPRSTAGWVHVYGDHPDEAILHLEAAMRLDPLDPGIGLPLSGIACAHMLAGRIPEAVDAAERAVTASPGIVSAHRARVAARGLAGLPSAAALAALLEAAPGFTLVSYSRARGAHAVRRLYHVVLDGLTRAGVPPGRPSGTVVRLRPAGSQVA